MGERPEPLLPADRDVRDLDGFMLNVERLLASELLAIGSPEECWAAFLLWCRSWKQIPGGTLPNDDRILASFSGAGKRWAKVRDVALHGFVLCSDNRFYHRFLCAEVERAYQRKTAYQTRRETDRKRLAEWRARRVPNDDVTADETRFAAEDTGQGLRKEKSSLSGAKKERKAEVPTDWVPDESGVAFADERAGWKAERLGDEVEKFRDHHRKLGNSFADVGAAWRTWVRNGAKFDEATRAKGANGSYGEHFAYAEGSVEHWRDRLRGWTDASRGGPTRDRWHDVPWGPPPGEPGCLVPRQLLTEFNLGDTP